MNAFFLAILSSIILSLDQVLIKLFINKYSITNLSSLLNIKSIIFLSLIFIIAIIGLGFWFFAIQKSDLTKIYWISSLYYLLVPIFSIFILDEDLSNNQWIGYSIITFGAILAAKK